MEDSKEPQAEEPQAEEPQAEEPQAEEPQAEKNIHKKLNEAYQKNESIQNKYLRALADIENLRKRSIREREESTTRARIELFSDLLPFLDSFNLGLNEAKKSETGEEFIQGFSMAMNQFAGTFKEYGFEAIDPKEEKFDSKFHEAIGYEDSADHKDGTIMKTVRIGYVLKDKLLRPASVILARNTSPSES